MMMSKPTPSSSESEKSAPVVNASKGTVADLERRLAMLSSDEATAATATATTTSPPPPLAAPPAAAAAKQSGKNALLARIMAAQERAKQTHQGEAVELQPPPQQQQEQQEQEHEQPPPPAFDDDLLMSMDTDVPPPPPSPPPPVYTYSEPQPPPALNAAVHVHGLAPPSMFSVPVAPVTAAVAPPSMSMWDPHAPSAPAMEDLFEDTAVTAPNQMQTNDPTPPSMDDWGNLQVIVMAPPAPTANANTNTNNTTNNNNNNTTSNEMDPAMVEAILGIEGLSNQEKRELLDEQKRIMASIESEKVAATNSTATDRANAFEQRSFSAAVQSVGSATTTTTTTTRARVPTAAASDGTNTRTVNLGDGQEVALHGQERTRQAIAEGTAILVQCTCCSNWMQVTETATLMFCPVCQVVSPVVQETGRGEEAAQLKSDQEMAEQLQKEEYKAAGREERKAAKAVRAVQEEQSQSWMEYFGMSTSTTSSAAVRPSSQPPAFAIPAERPRERGELGVSRPPGAGPRTGKPGLSVAHTGEERGQSQTITFSNSYDEHDGLLMNSSGGTRKLPAARVAGQQPLFNCVADSITSAASQAMTAIHTHTLGQDEEGNVHGVDSSGLLAVTNVGRETRYEPLNDGGGGGQGKN